jgi:hypothetical protein
MPVINVYRSLLFLMGIYSNSCGPFNKMETVFLFFLVLFHILLCKKHKATVETTEDVCSSVDFHCIAE